jgi:hypothetical protein
MAEEMVNDQQENVILAESKPEVRCDRRAGDDACNVERDSCNQPSSADVDCTL